MAITECMKPVESSMFSRAGYDPETWSLLLEFKSTREVRAYQNVDPGVADDFLTSKSLGAWFNQNIRGHGEDWPHEVLFTAEKKSEKPSDPPSDLDRDWDAMEQSWPKHEQLPVPPMAEINHVEGLAVEATNTGNITVETLARGFMEHSIHGLPAAVGDVIPMTAGESYAGISRADVLSPIPVPETALQAITILQAHQSQVEALVRENALQAKDALTIRVTDQRSHAGAGLIVRQLVEAKDRAVTLLEPFRKLLYDTYTAANGFKKQAVEPLEGAIKHVNSQLNGWEAEQERIRQRRIREEQERAEAEARRIQAEQAQQLTLVEMTDAIEMGDTKRAEELIEKPIEVPLPYVAPAQVEPQYIPPAGTSKVDNWKVDEERIDLVGFLRAVKDGKLEIDVAAKYILPNLPALNRIAKGMEDKFNIPGFCVKNDQIRRTRRGK